MKSNALWAMVAGLLVLFVALPVAEAQAPKPMSFVKEKHAELMKVMALKVSDGEAATKRAEQLRTLISGLVDYEDLAIRSLGKHWELRTPEEQSEYQGLFRTLVELTYVDRLGNRNPNAQYKVDWESEKVKKDRAHVICFVLYEDTETELEFILVEKAQSYLVSDLLIDGASLEDTYHRKYSEQIDKEGYASLVKQMKERIEELEKKTAAKAK